MRISSGLSFSSSSRASKDREEEPRGALHRRRLRARPSASALRLPSWERVSVPSEVHAASMAAKTAERAYNYTARLDDAVADKVRRSDMDSVRAWLLPPHGKEGRQRARGTLSWRGQVLHVRWDREETPRAPSPNLSYC